MDRDMTRVAETHAPDADYAEVRRHFEDQELVDLTTLIGMINLWNRLAIGFRYQHPAEPRGECRPAILAGAAGRDKACLLAVIIIPLMA